MKKRASKGIGRRQALRRLVAGAGAASALPQIAHAKPVEPKATMAGMPMPLQQALGAAEPPDLSLASPDWKPKFFDEHENETLVALSDLIIPATDTPGAKAAQVNRFIDLYLAAESPETQKQYLQALASLDGSCLAKYTKPFTALARSEQDEVLTLLTHRPSSPDPTPGFQQFQILKGSIIEAYYSSEIGALQELKYQTNPIQPEFPGCKNPGEH
jgi:glucoside 3-dehydrogenase (cytochrome c) hitch-hiker subunit